MQPWIRFTEVCRDVWDMIQMFLQGIFQGRRFGQLKRVAWKWKLMVGTIGGMLMCLGIFTFPLFILNEATRVAVWATWQADNQNLHILKEGVRVIRTINNTSKTINRLGGWLHPISYQSYKAFTNATDYCQLSCSPSARIATTGAQAKLMARNADGSLPAIP